MAEQTGNLSTGERQFSGLFGAALSLLALSRGGPLFRLVTGVAGSAFLMRAATGHCAVKSAMLGHTTLREGLADQWDRLRGQAGRVAEGLPGSPANQHRQQAVDESVEESFPASDAPASRLPDEPPSNAEAKWEAARKAERGTH